MKTLTAILSLFLSLTAYGQLSTVTVSTTPSMQIPNDFLGLSMEWDNLSYGGRAQTLMGTTATGVDTIFQHLVSNLALTGPVPFRIGGNSTNLFTTPDSVTALSQFYTATGSTFWLGINQETATTAQSVAQALAYSTNMPPGSVRGFEIGNEPDLYSPVWTWNNYYSSLSSLISGVQAAVPGSKFIYPSCAAYWCGSNWLFAGTYAINRTVTQANSLHLYATGNSASSGYLLTSAAYSWLPAFKPAASTARRAGNKFRVDEMNSGSGGGSPGVSNAFESALWVLDSMFSLASSGVDGVNIHGCDINTTSSICNYYDAMSIQITAGSPNTFSLVQVWPIYYGMQAFQEALGTGNAKIYPATIAAGTSSLVNAWDLIDSSGVQRSIIINLDTVNSGSVALTPNGTFSSATCYTLTAPSYSSTTGVTLHGQTYDGSTTGAISGIYTTTTLTPIAGVFSIPLAITQAQICTFNP